MKKNENGKEKHIEEEHGERKSKNIERKT